MSEQINKNLPQVNIAGMLINAITKKQFLQEITKRLQKKQKTFVITPYSEFLYEALINKEWRELCNGADMAVADGIAILWAAVFLSIKFRSVGYYGKIVESLWHVVKTGALILLKPASVRTIVPEKIVGADIFWDLAAAAHAKNKSLYLLGGFNQTPKMVAEKLKSRFPGISIAGYSNKNPDDASILSDIGKADPDIIFVAFGPFVQERWIAQHYKKLPNALMIGLGGTFDYVAGIRKQPPKFIRGIGLEWMYRLITQPHRVNRIFNATYRLIRALVRYKVFMSCPYRSNVVAVVYNEKKQFLLGKRTRYVKNKVEERRKNYWQFPQGGTNHGETIEAAAARELEEEMGISSIVCTGASSKTHSYIWTQGDRKLLTDPLRFKGQYQRVVYFKFVGSNKEIKLDHQEFSEYQWVDFNKTSAILHPERLPILKIALHDLKIKALNK